LPRNPQDFNDRLTGASLKESFLHALRVTRAGATTGFTSGGHYYDALNVWKRTEWGDIAKVSIHQGHPVFAAAAISPALN